MAMMIEGGSDTDIEEIFRRHEQEERERKRKRRAATYHKRKVIIAKCSDGTYHFFTSVYDLKYQETKIIYDDKGKKNVLVTKEVYYETISAEERTLRKLRDMPDRDSALNGEDTQRAPRRGGGTRIEE